MLNNIGDETGAKSFNHVCIGTTHNMKPIGEPSFTIDNEKYYFVLTTCNYFFSNKFIFLSSNNVACFFSKNGLPFRSDKIVQFIKTDLHYFVYAGKNCIILSLSIFSNYIEINFFNQNYQVFNMNSCKKYIKLFEDCYQDYRKKALSNHV
jgi:hypothetical protein